MLCAGSWPLRSRGPSLAEAMGTRCRGGPARVRVASTREPRTCRACPFRGARVRRAWRTRGRELARARWGRSWSRAVPRRPAGVHGFRTMGVRCALRRPGQPASMPARPASTPWLAEAYRFRRGAAGRCPSSRPRPSVGSRGLRSKSSRSTAVLASSGGVRERYRRPGDDCALDDPTAAPSPVRPLDDE